MEDSLRLSTNLRSPAYIYKIFIEQYSSEPKVKVLIPMYEPLEISKCNKCGKVIAEPKEVIRIAKSNHFVE